MHALIGQRPMFYQSIKHRKSVFCCFACVKSISIKANEEASSMYYNVIKHSRHLRTLKKCRKYSPDRVFFISLEFSNVRRVLSQCNTRLRLLYLLKIVNADSIAF